MLRNKIYIFFVLFALFFISCKSEESGDVTAPSLIAISPVDKAINIDTNAVITVKYNDHILLAPNAQIKLNEVVVTATVAANVLTINAHLLNNTTYNLLIPSTAVSDEVGNFAKEIKASFTTIATVTQNGTLFEAESATLTADAVIASSMSGFTGTGYVTTNSGNVSFTVQAVKAGYYDMSLRYSTLGAQKRNDLYVDGVKATSVVFSSVNVWTTLFAGKLRLSSGSHTISIVKDWGFMQLDNMTLTYSGTSLTPFTVAPGLVTPNPTTQVVKLYEFLKNNFGTKIISGTMANHSTNIDEATWVNTQTGKWPALTCFDFIDHTYANQSWVKYTAPLTLGQDWWNNNGIVALMWHWRDPLTKSGEFYTEKTSFDISKITDVNSAEYKAMITDIDVISGYLKQFKEANIPVIWRPLHEASGGWFWWGAKGAAPCKALWKIMFDRMVTYHGLNNLIWVWTTDVSDDAIDWYPGDNYVDIIGMDIYPGPNQHGSQYFSYNKVKELFGGKKLITLSECGSVPDPALMKENGDMWSWYMPWNGDYNRSDFHNGATWWKKYFNYDYVITRDQMPSLK